MLSPFARSARGLLAAVSPLPVLCCNSLLDNPPGELATSAGSGSSGGVHTAVPRTGGRSSSNGGRQVGTGGESSAGAAGEFEGGSGGNASSGGGATSHGGSGNAGNAAGTSGGVNTSGGASTSGTATSSGGTSTLPQLPAQPVLWLMADRGVSVQGERVSKVADQSGQGHDASQTNSGQMPRIVASASGPPLLEFDGADDALALPAGFKDFSGAGFFAVVEALPNAGCAGILSFSNGDDRDDVEFGRHTPNLLYYEVLGSFVEGAKNAFEVDRRFLISIVQDNAGNVELRLNRTLTGSGKMLVPAAVSRAQNFVGKDVYDECPTPYHGRLGELILYARGVSGSERQELEDYLATRWGLQL
ncbi:MAG TPA: hypothetical protein VFQ61_33995 [Polyangiaceae bacterium]|nr:hypothetical protein [Polyangiaceae bacterium]